MRPKLPLDFFLHPGPPPPPSFHRCNTKNCGLTLQHPASLPPPPPSALCVFHIVRVSFLKLFTIMSFPREKPSGQRVRDGGSHPSQNKIQSPLPGSRVGFLSTQPALCPGLKTHGRFKALMWLSQNSLFLNKRPSIFMLHWVLQIM